MYKCADCATMDAKNKKEFQIWKRGPIGVNKGCDYCGKKKNMSGKKILTRYVHDNLPAFLTEGLQQ